MVVVTKWSADLETRNRIHQTNICVFENWLQKCTLYPTSPFIKNVGRCRKYCRNSSFLLKLISLLFELDGQ